jgi:protein-L-isoaspartate O-methyltransferase
MDWETHARRLAADVVRPDSRWHEPLATTPRHEFVPRWFANKGCRWVLRHGADDTEAWMHAAYTDQTLVTRVGPLHADYAEPGSVTEGQPTSSSTLPGLVVQMYRHAMLTDETDVLVTTGTGYGTALACRRLGAERVTSLDVDAVLVMLAGKRLSGMGLRPNMGVCDITGPLPGSYDRIVSTVSVRPVPASWLAALRPGGRDDARGDGADRHGGQDGGRRRGRAHRVGRRRVHADPDRRRLRPAHRRPVGEGQQR